MPSLKHWVWLAERRVSNQTRLALLRHFEDPTALFYASPEEILLAEGVAKEQAEALEDRDLSGAAEILAKCRDQGIRLLTIRDADYPDRLRNVYDAPILLYVRGRLPVMDEEAAVALVGTRTCTPYGERSAERLGYGLAKGGAVVVSGMAKGIDAAGVRGALRAGGAVVGVLGGGIDVVYPPENAYLYEDVAAAGALVSEYPPGTRPMGRHFPVRNRILSGLSVATLVVEAPMQSGALITAEIALDQGRDVFAVPGPIDAPSSAGCNRLIRDGGGLAACAGDVLRVYRDRFPDKLRLEDAEDPPAMPRQARQRPGARESAAVRESGESTVKEMAEVREMPEVQEARPALPILSLSKNNYPLTDDQMTLLRLLTEEPQLADDLIDRSGIPTRRVLSALTVLEIEGLAAQHSGKRYTRTVRVVD